MRAALSGEYNWQVPDSSRDKGTYSEVIRSRASSRTRSGGAGIKIAAVARQLGVSRSWASRKANAAGTRILIAELLDSQREHSSALFDHTLDLIKDALQARRASW